MRKCLKLFFKKALQINKLEKQEQIKVKVSRRKNMVIKTRVEINEILKNKR